MIFTFDRKEKHINQHYISIIPISDKDELVDENEKDKSRLYISVLNELSYRPASDYKQMSEEEIREYISDYYNDVLSKIDPGNLLGELRFSVLMSDERVDSLAIRHIVSEWLNIYSNEGVNESRIDEEGNLVKVERPSFIRPILEDIIKENKKDMKGFNSLRALYLYEKSEKLEDKAEVLKEKDCEEYEYLKQTANYLRGEAYTAEDRYNNKSTSPKTFRRKYTKLVRWNS